MDLPPPATALGRPQADGPGNSAASDSQQIDTEALTQPGSTDKAPMDHENHTAQDLSHPEQLAEHTLVLQQLQTQQPSSSLFLNDLGSPNSPSIAPGVSVTTNTSPVSSLTSPTLMHSVSRNVSFASDSAESSAYREHNPPAVLRRQEAARRDNSPAMDIPGRQNSMIPRDKEQLTRMYDIEYLPTAVNASANSNAAAAAATGAAGPQGSQGSSTGGNHSPVPSSRSSSLASNPGSASGRPSFNHYRPPNQQSTFNSPRYAGFSLNTGHPAAFPGMVSPTSSTPSPTTVEPHKVLFPVEETTSGDSNGQDRGKEMPVRLNENEKSPTAAPTALEPSSSKSDSFAIEPSGTTAATGAGSTVNAIPSTSSGKGEARRAERRSESSDRASDRAVAAPGPDENRSDEVHILVAVTGSVATIKLPQIVHKLKQLYREKAVIQVVVTKASTTFFDLQDLPRGIKVWYDSDEWRSREASVSGHVGSSIASPGSNTGPSTNSDQQLHIRLRRWADILLVAPCSANTLAKLTYGICDNLLTSIFRVWNPEVPILLAPAMNTHMYTNPVTKRHFDIIRESFPFVEILKPVEKVLVCGDIGMGGMREWNDIVQVLVKRIDVNLESDTDDDEEDEV